MAWMRNVLGRDQREGDLRLDTCTAFVGGDGAARHFLRMQQLFKTQVHSSAAHAEIIPGCARS